MPDDVLRISTAVDLAPITQGMPLAASTVETSTNRMAAGFQKVAGASTTVDVKLASTAQGMQRLGQAAVTDAEQIKILQEQVEILNTKLAELEVRLAQAPRRGSAEFTEARHAIMGVGEEIGVRMPRFLTTFLSHLGGVAPIMAAAFSAVAVIALIQIIPELISKIRETAEAIAGWDAEAKKAYNSMLEANRQLYIEMLKQHAAHRELAEIGTTGQLKMKLSQDATRGSMQEMNKELGNTLRAQQQTQAEIETTHKAWKGLFDLHTYAVALWLTDEEEVNNRLKNQRSTIDDLTKSLRDYRDQLQFKDPAEAAADARSRALAMTQAQTDALRKLNSDSVGFQEQTIRQMFAAGQISREQEVQALQAAEEQKYQIELRYINQRKALAAQKERTTGEPAGPEVTKLNAEQEGLELGHQTRMHAIALTGRMEMQQEENAAAVASVEGARKVVDAKVQLAEQTARQLRATRQISITEEATELKSAETMRYNAEVSSLQKQLDVAKQFPEKNRAMIINLQAELEAAEISHKARLTGIDTEADNQRMAESRRMMMEQIRYAQESAHIQLQIARQSADAQLKAHQMGVEQWRAISIKALNDWYNSERTALEKELAAAKQIYGQNSIEYQKMIDKLKLLDQQRLREVNAVNDQVRASYQRLYNSITEGLISNMDRWAAGYEKTSDMWKNLWQSMSTTFVRNLMVMMAQEVAAHVLHMTLAKSEAQSDAGSAAVKVFKKVIDALPFPANVIVAPIAAAGVYMGAMAFGHFERGGITEHGGPALLHPKEMVLPRNISEPLQGMLADHATTANRSLPITMMRSGTPGVGTGSMTVGAGSTNTFPSIVAPPPIAAGRSIAELHGGSDVTGKGAGTGLLGSFLSDPATALQFRRVIAAGVGDASGHRQTPAHVTYAPTVHNGPSDMGDMLSNHSADLRRIIQDEMRRGGLPSV